MSKQWQGMAAGVLLLAGSVAHAALVAYQANGVDLVYDAQPGVSSTQGLTWTADANLAASNTFGLATGADLGVYPGDSSGVQGRINANGRMNWPGALFWIDAMNAANYAGANDWRLWSALNSDGSDPCGPGNNCTDSELGHLYYVEGGLTAGSPITDSTALTNVFSNMQGAGSSYWSSTEADSVNAWLFFTDSGFQTDGIKGGGNELFGWAVRQGQVAAAPLPGTALLMALGLGGIAFLRRARRQIR